MQYEEKAQTPGSIEQAPTEFHKLLGHVGQTNNELNLLNDLLEELCERIGLDSAPTTSGPVADAARPLGFLGQLQAALDYETDQITRLRAAVVRLQLLA